jgi:CxxC motif-containing protein (DUF1111 family)
MNKILLAFFVFSVNLQANPQKPGGDNTTNSESTMAFSLPHPKISKKNKTEFFVGKSFFRQNWVTQPASVKTLEGLGPTFIAHSCIACHVQDGRGRPPLNKEESFEALLLRISVPGKNPHGGVKATEKYGDQIQNQSIPGVQTEGRPTVEYIEIKGHFSDGTEYSLAKPTYKIESLAFGDLPKDVMISPRIAPAVFGLGLLEAIPDEDILQNVDSDDKNADGISGQANYVWDVKKNKLSLGRFGWKANQPSLEQQTAGAFLGDMGITSSLFAKNNCPPVQTACLKASSKKESEINQKNFRSVVVYSHLLSVPQRRTLSELELQLGEKIMNDLKCTACHVPKFQTSATAEFKENAAQIIYPYTDLLLHDMGDDLADGRPDFLASGREWRTAPLWGIGLVSKVNKHTRFLHDGRARSIEEAILWHGGEAKASQEAYKKLSKAQRSQLIKFIEVL